MPYGTCPEPVNITCSNMCAKPVRPGDLVLRADVIPHVDGDGRRRMVLRQDDGEAVRQRVLLERNVDRRFSARGLGRRLCAQDRGEPAPTSGATSADSADAVCNAESGSYHDRRVTGCACRRLTMKDVRRNANARPSFGVVRYIPYNASEAPRAVVARLWIRILVRPDAPARAGDGRTGAARPHRVLVSPPRPRRRHDRVDRRHARDRAIASDDHARRARVAGQRGRSSTPRRLRPRSHRLRSSKKLSRYLRDAVCVSGASKYDAVIDCMVTAPSVTTLLLILASGARYRIGIAGRGNDAAFNVTVPAERASTHTWSTCSPRSPRRSASSRRSIERRPTLEVDRCRACAPRDSGMGDHPTAPAAFS